MQKQFYIYLLTNHTNTVIYVGVTNNLPRRIYEHKNKLIAGFSQKYNVSKLVYYEVFESAYEAITREKQIKSGSRKKKEELISKANPNYSDLYNSIL